MQGQAETGVENNVEEVVERNLEEVVEEVERNVVEVEEVEEVERNVVLHNGDRLVTAHCRLGEDTGMEQVGTGTNIHS